MNKKLVILSIDCNEEEIRELIECLERALKNKPYDVLFTNKNVNASSHVEVIQSLTRVFGELKEKQESE